MRDESGLSCPEHCFCTVLTCMPPVSVCCRCGYSYTTKLSGHYADMLTVTVPATGWPEGFVFKNVTNA